MARKTKKQKQLTEKRQTVQKSTQSSTHDAEAAYFRHDVRKSAIIIAAIITLEIIIYFGTMKYRFFT